MEATVEAKASERAVGATLLVVEAEVLTVRMACTMW
jgi:hypothetical protein